MKLAVVAPLAVRLSSVSARASRSGLSWSSASSFAASVFASASTSRSASRSEEHTYELQSLMRNSYARYCLKKKNTQKQTGTKNHHEPTHSQLNNNKTTNQ